MKKKITFLVLVSILVFGSMVSCQPEPEVIEKEIIKEVTIAKEYFPAPESVTVQNPDPNNSSNIKINWKFVPNAESYVIYLKKENGHIYFSKTVSFPNYLNESLYYSFDKTNISNTTDYSDDHIVGVKAISIDGVNSPVRWNK